jgi:hypothetical protein
MFSQTSYNGKYKPTAFKEMKTWDRLKDQFSYYYDFTSILHDHLEQKEKPALENEINQVQAQHTNNSKLPLLFTKLEELQEKLKVLQSLLHTRQNALSALVRIGKYQHQIQDNYFTSFLSIFVNSRKLVEAYCCFFLCFEDDYLKQVVPSGSGDSNQAGSRGNGKGGEDDALYQRLKRLSPILEAMTIEIGNKELESNVPHIVKDLYRIKGISNPYLHDQENDTPIIRSQTKNGSQSPPKQNRRFTTEAKLNDKVKETEITIMQIRERGE